MRKFLLLIIAATGLTACASDAHLKYVSVADPAPVSTQVTPAIIRVAATDNRGKEPNYLGTIRGGYGNPLKVRSTTNPVSDEVAKVFTDALVVRGLYDTSGNGRYEILLTIRRFDANQLIHVEANVDMDVSVLDKSTHKSIFGQQIVGHDQYLQLIGAGVLASTDDLQALAEKVLSNGIDRLLNDPAFIQAIATPRP